MTTSPFNTQPTFIGYKRAYLVADVTDDGRLSRPRFGSYTTQLTYRRDDTAYCLYNAMAEAGLRIPNHGPAADYRPHTPPGDTCVCGFWTTTRRRTVHHTFSGGAVMGPAQSVVCIAYSYGEVIEATDGHRSSHQKIAAIEAAPYCYCGLPTGRFGPGPETKEGRFIEPRCLEHLEGIGWTAEDLSGIYGVGVSFDPELNPTRIADADRRPDPLEVIAALQKAEGSLSKYRVS